MGYDDEEYDEEGYDEEEYEEEESTYRVIATCTAKLPPKLLVPKCCKSGEAIDTR